MSTDAIKVRNIEQRFPAAAGTQVVPPGYRRSEVGVIPEDWEVKQLREISPSQSVGLVINPSSYFDDDGTVPMLVGSNISENQIDWESANRITAESNERVSASILAAGDLVMVRVGDPGVTATIPPELDGCNCASMMIIRKHRSFDSTWLCFVLNSKIGRLQVEYVQYGTAQKQFNISDAIRFVYPVPSLTEQRAIAEALADVDGLLRALEALIAKKRAIKQAAMQQLLTGKARLPGFRGEWETKRLGVFASIRNQKVMPSQSDPATPCVELEHIGQADGHLIAYSTAADSTSSKSRFFSGDVLFGRLRPYLRKYWLADFNGICTTEIWPLVVDPTQADSGFFLGVVQTDRFIESASISYGTHMPRADWGVMRNLEIAVPSVGEQTAIATVLSDMEAEIAALEARRDKTRGIKEGMMQQLLTGRVRLVAPEAAA